MTWFVRIFTLLLLAGSIVAQDAPTAPEPAKADPAPVEPIPAEVPEAPAKVEEPAEPTWDPVADAPRAPSRARARNRPQQWGARREGQVGFGQNILVRTNESVHDLVLIGGSADIQGEVERDVVAIGASVKVSGKIGGEVVIVGGEGDFSGEVDGDVVVVVGRANVTNTAKLDREVVFIGGPFDIHPEASIRGQQTVMPLGDFLPEIEWAKTYLVRGPLLGRWLAFDLGWPWAIAGTFLAIYFALLLIFPSASRAVYSALEERPVTSVFTGLLTLILLAPLTLLLVVSVVGILVIPFMKIAVILALLFGKVGVICFIGRGFARTSGAAKFQVPIFAFLIGGVILTLAYAIPFFGIFAWAVVTVFGFGGAIVALSNTFKREEAKVPPAPVLVSTIRPPGYGTANVNAPAASAPIPGASSPGVGSGVASATFAQLAAALSPQDTVLLPRAGFWARLLAALFDLFLLTVLVIWLPVVGLALFIPFAVAYFVAMWTWKGTTIGGLVMGHKVVRTDGREVDFPVAIVRSLLSIFSCFVAFLGCLWAAWDHEKQTWHDKIAGTVVVKMPRDFALI